MHCFILCLFVANKKDDATTAAHSKRIIELLQHIQLILVDSLMSVINNFCGDGVWKFINFIRLMIMNDHCERSMAGLTVSA